MKAWFIWWFIFETSYMFLYIHAHIICNVSFAHGEKYFLQKFNCILMTCVRVVWEVQLLGRLSPWLFHSPETHYFKVKRSRILNILNIDDAFTHYHYTRLPFGFFKVFFWLIKFHTFTFDKKCYKKVCITSMFTTLTIVYHPFVFDDPSLNRITLFKRLFYG